MRPGLVRFILALLVVISHFSNFFMLGRFAVCGFFILSGYWISLMYDKKYSLKENKITVFYISRLWRIFPMFYFFSALGLIVTLKFYPNFPAIIMALHFWPKIAAFSSNLLIIGNASLKHRILGPSWTLEVEILFYLLFPFVALLIKKKKLNAILLTIFFFLITVYLVLNYNKQFEHTGLPYLFLFLFGVLTYHYHLIFSKKLEFFSAGIFLLILLFNYSLSSLHLALMKEGIYFNCITLLLVIFTIPSIINSVYIKSTASDKILGDLSFIVYLCHWVWIEAYYVLIQEYPSITSKLGYAFLTALITAITSYLAYTYLDRPIEKKRHAWVNSRKNSISNS